jgi:integrase
MGARRLFEDDQPSLPIRLFQGPESHSDTRSAYPGVGAPPSKPANLDAIFAAVRDDHELDQPELSADQFALAKSVWPLSQFYFEALADWQRRRLGNNQVQPGTLQKERQSLACFDEWDKLQQPDNWPAGHIWRGLPVGYLAGHYFERWAKARLETLAVDTVESRWCALRTIINWAKTLGVTSVQLPNLAPLFDQERKKLAKLGEYDFTPTSYTIQELEAVYFALANEPDLQTAWVLGATIGPRTVDLFSLRWGANVQLNASPPEVWYIAKKTGKVHWVPLPPCAVAHLRRLARSQGHLNPDEPEGLVFPRLTAGGSKDPEKSRSARARNDRIKAALLSSGLDANNEASDYYKPIQVLRSTCNSRLNNHDAGKGLLITHGKDADVSSQAYWNERDSIIEAVMSLPQPTAFLSL